VRPAALRIGRFPPGAEGEVDAAVAVDVVRLVADVVARGGPLQDHMLRPAGIGEPDDRVVGNGDDIRAAVCVHVGGRHREADLADMRDDLLRLAARELGRVGRNHRRRQGTQGDEAWSHGQPLEFSESDS
jgi:hypothetical protein